MTLTEKINNDLKSAMKSGDSIKLNTIRSIRAQIIEFSKREEGVSLNSEDELAVLLAAAKRRKEAIDMYNKAGRNDLADIEQQELLIINTYLPKQMTREEGEIHVRKIIDQVGATSSKDFSKIMPLAMKELKGKIDGKIVQDIVRQQLGE